MAESGTTKRALRLPGTRPDHLRLLRAEWTKLRSVPRWMMGLASAAVITALVGLLVAAGTSASFAGEITTGPDGRPVTDDFHFVHQPLTGDGTVTARVVSQSAVDQDGEPDEPQPWAKAGVMIKEALVPGSSYAAVMATPGHGVRMQANFTTDTAGSDTAAPRWLRLERDGHTVTGFESADGAEWTRIGSVELDDLPDSVSAGFFVASPDEVRVERRSGGRTMVGGSSTMGTATFDNVALNGLTSEPGSWESERFAGGGANGPFEYSDGVYTVTGSGDIADNPPDEDVVQLSQLGVIVGSLAVIAVCVLFVTTEYRRGMIRATLAATPRRGRVLLAKALVAGGVTFVAGLAGCFAAFFLAQPRLRANGLAPPRYPEPSLSDPNVLRAIVGGAALLAVVAVLSVAAAVVVRRSAAAIALVTAVFFLPALLSVALPPELAEWPARLTPASGLAIQRALEPADSNFGIAPWTMIPPWHGFGVLCLYTAAALLAASWLIRRRDA